MALLAPLANAETLTLTSAAPEPIPDGSEALLVLPAAPPGNPVVAGVSVDLDVAHHWLGDLIITVEHEGVVVRLIDRMGLAYLPFACGGDDISATFEDGATVVPEDLCWPGPGPVVTGLVLPTDALTAFAGLPADGDWTIRATDAAAHDAGTVTSVTIRIDLAAPTVCVGDVNGDGLTNAGDFTILAGSFGAAVAPNTSGDLNSDGMVNAADFTILAGDFGCDVN